MTQTTSPSANRRGLDGLEFDNRFTRDLPADPDPGNRRRQVHGAGYSRVTPRPVAAPSLLAYAREAAGLIDLGPADCESTQFTEIFAGNQQLPGMDPHASCYGGHQFGNWAGQLGDGRAINLGEVISHAGQRWVLQLKGAGPTPYSRSADGLAVLRSSLREFICSEAMHHLGVPTTRALSLIASGETVVRDMLYDGHPRAEPGAVVCRMAPSFTRFGHFELPTTRGDIDLLRKFVDATIATDFAHLGPPSRQVYAQWFDQVCRSTADLMVHWMRVGFVHGVMNTDNMSILGLTIDYGPYGWLEDYDPDWTPNTTDAQHRRYRFGQQAQIAQWNLLQLAYAIYPLLEDNAPLEQSLNDYASHYQGGWNRMMATKLGLVAFDPATDTDLIAGLLRILPRVETDMTLFFRALAEREPPATVNAEPGWRALAEAYYRPEQIDADYNQDLQHWLRDYDLRLRRDDQPDIERRARMHAVNPLYVPRNYLAQLAIDDAEQGNLDRLHELLEVFRDPYRVQAGKSHCAAKRPDWARTRVGCSMLSCSS